MKWYIGLTALAVLIAYGIETQEPDSRYGVTRRKAQSQVLFAAVFLLLFGVSACRVSVGNDYGEYLKLFERISLRQHVSSEIGFNVLTAVLQYLLGYNVWCGRMILALFSLGTVWFFLKAIYDQSVDFPAALFLLMTQGFYFNSLNTVRYYFALSVALYAMKYAIEKKWLPFVGCIVFAALFHKSVLLVIPAYFLATLPWKKWMVALAGVFCASLVVFPGFYRRIIFAIYPFYENSAFDRAQISYVNIAKCGAVVVFSLLFYKKVIRKNRANKFYFILNVGALLTYCFGSFIPEVSRVAYYFSISNIFLLPAVLSEIPGKRMRLFFKACVGVAFFIYFIVFLQKSYDINIRLLPYHSWILE